MARLTERWGSNEGNISGRAICRQWGCDSVDCALCWISSINNRLADYEDAIPYERLDEAAELLRQKDFEKSNRYSVAVKKTWRHSL